MADVPRFLLHKFILAWIIFLPFSANAQLDLSDKVTLPLFTVEDSATNTVGAAIGFVNWLPLVLLTDGADTALVRITKNYVSTKHRVFYTNDDCTGTAYLPAFTAGTSQNASGSFEELAGTVFGVGKPSGGGTLGILLKSNGIISQPTIQSAWLAQNSPPNCWVNGQGTGQDKFGVTVVQDLDTVFTPPFILN